MMQARHIRYEASTLLWKLIKASAAEANAIAMNKFFDWSAPRSKRPPNPYQPPSGQLRIHSRG